ncbi:hypothetical protein A1a_00026 [Klebsiella phage VLCpiA1a]|nr:hypothetical protein A1a_00026 [Klebsiella phage VLCpiA1a]
MSKFKVGDKVVRKAHKNNSSFKSYQGDFAYYVITDITTSGHWLQLDNFTDGGAGPYPWYADNFELYQEKGDELPPVPDSVMYFNSVRDEDNDQRLVVQMTSSDAGKWSDEANAHVGLMVIPRTGSTLSRNAIGINLAPDAALQLAHDLRRMAMDIKRKEKAQ